MKAITVVFIVWTLAGLGLSVFAIPGTAAWWDPIWVLLFAVSTYAGLASRLGLSAARWTAVTALATFAVLIGAAALVGSPQSPLQFTAHAGPRIADVLPVLVPLAAFALLGAWHQAIETFLPSSSKIRVSALTAVGFGVTLTNGLRFLSHDRLWWIWNPWGTAGSGVAVAGFLVLSLVVAILAWLWPSDASLRRTRWSSDAAAVLAVNILFLSAHIRGLLHHP